MSLFARGVDALLEASVVGSFTRVGPVVRRRLEHWSSFEGRDLSGRVYVVTGATSGLGLEAARRLAELRATVVIVARNASKAEGVRASIQLEFPGSDVQLVTAEMGDLASVRRAAQELSDRFPAIHVLVHNAGALDDVRAVTPQGIEQTVATHVVGPYLLTELLRPLLNRGAPARVLWVSSGGMYSEPLDVATLELDASTYDGTKAYAKAKRAQVTLNEVWAPQLRTDGIVMHAMHPGWADTPGVARSLPTFRKVVGPLLRNASEGVDTLLWLAIDDGAPVQDSGLFWLDRKPRPIHKLGSTRRSDTAGERAKLVAWVAAKAGVTPLTTPPG